MLGGLVDRFEEDLQVLGVAAEPQPGAGEVDAGRAELGAAGEAQGRVAGVERADVALDDGASGGCGGGGRVLVQLDAHHVDVDAEDQAQSGAAAAASGAHVDGAGGVAGLRWVEPAGGPRSGELVALRGGEGVEEGGQFVAVQGEQVGVAGCGDGAGGEGGGVTVTVGGGVVGGEGEQGEVFVAARVGGGGGCGHGGAPGLE